MQSQSIIVRAYELKACVLVSTLAKPGEIADVFS